MKSAIEKLFTGYVVLAMFSGVSLAEEQMESMDVTVSCEQEAVDMGIESSDELDAYITECTARSSQGEEVEEVEVIEIDVVTEE